MAVTVKKIVLWRKEVENRSGVLAETLAPLAKAGTDLQILLAYRYTGDQTKAAVEAYPVTGKKSQTAAQEAGLSAASIPVVLVEGDNKAGLGHRIAQSIAEAGISLNFVVAQVVGRKYSAVFGFDSEDAAAKGMTSIRKAVAAKK